MSKNVPRRYLIFIPMVIADIVIENLEFGTIEGITMVTRKIKNYYYKYF